MFSEIHRRTSSRPRLQENSVLYEEQGKFFSKHPDIFSKFEYENQEAEELLKSFSRESDEKSDEESDEEYDEERDDADEIVSKETDISPDEDIVVVLNKILNERENCDYYSDSEEDFDEDFECYDEREAR